MNMTLEEMLKNELADSLTLVSKHADLKRQVRAVESTEAPDGSYS